MTKYNPNLYATSAANQNRSRRGEERDKAELSKAEADRRINQAQNRIIKSMASRSNSSMGIRLKNHHNPYLFLQ